jgi:hypothetical protein
MLNSVIDQETIHCILMSGSSICFLFALLSCLLFRPLEIRKVKVMFLPVTLTVKLCLFMRSTNNYGFLETYEPNADGLGLLCNRKLCFSYKHVLVLLVGENLLLLAK